MARSLRKLCERRRRRHGQPFCFFGVYIVFVWPNALALRKVCAIPTGRSRDSRGQVARFGPEREDGRRNSRDLHLAAREHHSGVPFEAVVAFDKACLDLFRRLRGGRRRRCRSAVGRRCCCGGGLSIVTQGVLQASECRVDCRAVVRRRQAGVVFDEGDREGDTRRAKADAEGIVDLLLADHLLGLVCLLKPRERQSACQLRERGERFGELTKSEATR